MDKRLTPPPFSTLATLILFTLRNFFLIHQKWIICRFCYPIPMKSKKKLNVCSELTNTFEPIKEAAIWSESVSKFLTPRPPPSLLARNIPCVTQLSSPAGQARPPKQPVSKDNYRHPVQNSPGCSNIILLCFVISSWAESFLSFPNKGYGRTRLLTVCSAGRYPTHFPASCLHGSLRPTTKP